MAETSAVQMIKRRATYFAIASFLAVPVFLTPSASAACDISQTKCALNDGKCNIKFRNLTGASSGMAGGTDLSQESWAQTVKVKALKENGHTAGNVLSIDSDASKTMNLDKKANKNFAKIRITSPAMNRVKGVTMSCEDVQSVLDGNGTCKIFHGQYSGAEGYDDYGLGYSCDASKTVGPKG